MATIKNIYWFIDEREKESWRATMDSRLGMEVRMLESLCNRREQHMLLFGYTRIEVEEDLKIVSSKATTKAKTKLSARKSSGFFIKISLALPFFVEYVIDSLERIQAAILS